MSLERRTEAPQGFTWHFFDKTRVWALIPHGWHFTEGESTQFVGCWTFTITDKPLRIISEKPLNFTTDTESGKLTLVKFPFYKPPQGGSLGRFLKECFTPPGPDVIELRSEVEVIRNEPFISYVVLSYLKPQTRIKTTAMFTIPVTTEAMMSFVNFTGNLRTGTFYETHFVFKPEDLEKYRDVAKVLVLSFEFHPRG